MKIIWEDSAFEELNNAVAFIAKNSPQNAIMVLDGLIELAETLGFMPLKYPKEPFYDKKDIRFATKYNHKLIYQVKKDSIIILRVFPTRLNPNKLEKD